MAGTLEGGKAAAKTNRKKYGSDFYAKIGAKGGARGFTGGFYHMKQHNPERVSELGKKGGTISKRRPKNG